MNDGEKVELELASGRVLSIERQPSGAVVRIAAAGRGAELELRIAITEEGPVVCARAHAVSIEAEDTVTTRCRRFRVEADDAIELVAERAIFVRAGAEARIEAGTVDVVATLADLRLRANDDVQVLGEQVLLNCERQPPLPPWVPVPRPPEVLLPAVDTSGDADLVAALGGWR